MKRTRGDQDAPRAQQVRQTPTDHACSERVIGLDVGGRVFYTNVSTLTNASAYFAARFGGSLSPGSAYRDEQGREIYFLDRNGALFEFVLEYLRSGLRTWPTFQEDPMLWRRLRVEAEYFAIDGLVGMLEKTYSCTPKSSDKGVLYWLGTERGTRDYRNPSSTGVVGVTVWFDEYPEQNMYEPVVTKDERNAFVQYAPVVSVDRRDMNKPAFGLICPVLYCDNAFQRKPSVVTFRTVTVRPTNYSLRYDGCYGMTVWNFEGSTDGISWDTLHEARFDKHLLAPSNTAIEQLSKCLKEIEGLDAKKNVATDWTERHLRHTWELKPVPAKFYRHFRFIGVGGEAFDKLCEEHDELPESYCMHGVGFEVFGDVHEE